MSIFKPLIVVLTVLANHVIKRNIVSNCVTNVRQLQLSVFTLLDMLHGHKEQFGVCQGSLAQSTLPPAQTEVSLC